MKEEKRYYYPYGCTTLHEIHGWFEAGKFYFQCNSRGNRSGFVHEWKLYYDGSFYPVQENKIQYYNRTWERFTYESLLQDLFVDFLYSKDWKFWEENKDDIAAISKDLNLNLGKIFRMQDLKKELMEKYN